MYYFRYNPNISSALMDDCLNAHTYLPEAISGTGSYVTVGQHRARPTAAEIEFNIKFFGVIYGPPNV